MPVFQLTKDGDILICVLYKAYLENRENGMSKSAAKSFGGSKDIQKNLIPKWTPEDVDDTCRELGKIGALDCFYADGVVYDATLNDSAIIYMENRFRLGLTEVLEYIFKIAPLIFGQLPNLH